MNEDVFFTLLFVLVVALIIWHGAESSCQEEHNVHDCEWNFEIVPRIPDENSQ